MVRVDCCDATATANRSTPGSICDQGNAHFGLPDHSLLGPSFTFLVVAFSRRIRYASIDDTGEHYEGNRAKNLTYAVSQDREPARVIADSITYKRSEFGANRCACWSLREKCCCS
jgi:hypothetical protein